MVATRYQDFGEGHGQDARDVERCPFDEYPIVSYPAKNMDCARNPQSPWSLHPLRGGTCLQHLFLLAQLIAAVLLGACSENSNGPSGLASSGGSVGTGGTTDAGIVVDTMTPKLHVDGTDLVDVAGKKVLLHGWM